MKKNAEKILLRSLLSPCIALICLNGGNALSNDNSGIGVHGAAFMRISPVARAVAMGNAYAAVTGEISAIRYNVGTLATIDKVSLAANFHNWIEDTEQGAISVALPSKIGVFAFDFTYFNEGKIIEVDEEFFKTGGSSFSDDILLTLAYGRGFNVFGNQMSFGTGFKLLRQNLIGEQSSAMGIDVGLHYRVRFVTLGLSLQNISISKVKFKNIESSLPMTYRIGTGLEFSLSQSMHFNLAADAAKVKDEDMRYFAGAELVIGNLLALRGGYRFHDTDALRWASGIGLNIPTEWLANSQARLDYTYSPLEAFDSATHRFSLLIKFGVAEKAPVQDYSELRERMRRELEAAEKARLAAQASEERTREMEEEIARRLERIQQIAAESQGKIEVEPQADQKILVSMRINFDFDKANIRPEEFETMHKVGDILNTYPEAKVHISGHTDSIGTHEYNIHLSQRRMDSVMVFLANRENVYRDRFYMPVAYGETKPIDDNGTQEGRFRNRRVEFLLYTFDAQPELPEGSAIKNVEVLDDWTVRIECNGKVDYKHSYLVNPDRLVIDLPNLFLLTRIASYELDSGPFIRARLGYHPEAKYSRVVLDLRQKTEVEVTSQENYIIVKAK